MEQSRISLNDGHVYSSFEDVNQSHFLILRKNLRALQFLQDFKENYKSASCPKARVK